MDPYELTDIDGVKIKLKKVKLIKLEENGTVEIVSEHYEKFFQEIVQKFKNSNNMIIISNIENSYNNYNYDRRIKLYSTDTIKIDRKLKIYTTKTQEDEEDKEYEEDIEKNKEDINVFVDIEMIFDKIRQYPYQSSLNVIYWKSIEITVCDDQDFIANLVDKNDKKYSFITNDDFNLLKSINEKCKNEKNNDYIAGFLNAFNTKIKEMALINDSKYDDPKEFTVPFNLDLLNQKQIKDLHNFTNELFMGQYEFIEDRRIKVCYIGGYGPSTLLYSVFKKL